MQDVSAFNTGVMNYTGGSFPEQLRSGRVSADFFKLTGAPVLLGRTFTAGRRPAERPARHRDLAAVSGKRGSTPIPNIVGKSISLGGEPYTIVGVLGDFDFREFGPTPQVWVLFQFDPNTADQGHYFQAMGRLKPGVTLQQADARLKASAADYPRRSSRPRLDRRTRSACGPIRDVIVGDDVKSVAADLRRRRQLRAADRVRERREPAAGPRDGPPPRDRDPRRDRRIARPHHPPAPDRERRAVARGRPARTVRRLGRHPRAALDQHRRPAARRRERRPRRPRLARRRVHDRRLARHGPDLRPDPCAPELEDRPDDDAEGERGPVRHRLPAEQGALGARRRGSGAGAGAADRIRAADPHRGRARTRRSRASTRTTC